MNYKGYPPYSEPENILLCGNGCYYFNNMTFVDYKYLQYPIHNKFQIFANYSEEYQYDNNLRPNNDFESFLFKLSNGNNSLKTRIWQMIGYILSPDHTPGVVFVLQGKYNSGIRPLVRVIESFFDEEKLSHLDCKQLGKEDATTRLENKCLNITYDTAGEILSESAIDVVNRVANKDCPVDVRVSRGKYRKMFSRCKFLFVVSDRIKIKKRNDEFISRIIHIPINDSTLDKTYSELYTNSLLSKNNSSFKSFILNTSISAYNNLKMNFYRFEYINKTTDPVEVLSVEKAMDLKTRSVKGFIKDCCVIMICEESFTSDLYKSYLEYCSNYGLTGVDDVRVFSRILNHLLKDAGVVKFKKRRNGKGRPLSGFSCLGLKSK